MHLFFLSVLMFMLTGTSASRLQVTIKQTNAVVDPNPIINFSEIQFYMSGTLLSLTNDAFMFNEPSSGYQTEMCNDGIIATLPFPYNMCKSSNTNATEKFLQITLNAAFDQIKVYNAYGFLNVYGHDVGDRVIGAVLTVEYITSTTSATLFSETFLSNSPVYTFYVSTPTWRPNSKPTAVPTAFTPKPSVSLKPSFQPNFS